MPSHEEDVKFLCSIIKQVETKGIDWGAVTDECGIPSKGAAQMRFRRLKERNEKALAPASSKASGNVGGINKAAIKRKGKDVDDFMEEDSESKSSSGKRAKKEGNVKVKTEQNDDDDMEETAGAKSFVKKGIAKSISGKGKAKGVKKAAPVPEKEEDILGDDGEQDSPSRQLLDSAQNVNTGTTSSVSLPTIRIFAHYYPSQTKISPCQTPSNPPTIPSTMNGRPTPDQSGTPAASTPIVISPPRVVPSPPPPLASTPVQGLNTSPGPSPRTISIPHPLFQVHSAADTEATDVVVEEAAARLSRQNLDANIEMDTERENANNSSMNVYIDETATLSAIPAAELLENSLAAPRGDEPLRQRTNEAVSGRSLLGPGGSEDDRAKSPSVDPENIEDAGQENSSSPKDGASHRVVPLK